MRSAITISTLLALSLPVLVSAESPKLYTDIQADIEYNKLEGLSLGGDAGLERLIERDYELELDLEYRPSNELGLFMTAALIDETERVSPAGLEQSRSGLELKEIGLSYFFGDVVQTELKLGRIEYESTSQWWSLWDDELDSICLQSRTGDIETLLVLAEEQLPESTSDDFIEPELDDLERFFLSVNWEIIEGHSVEFHYLKQRDNSSNYSVGERLKNERIDDEDADLTWQGISYLTELDHDSLGSFNLELHYTEVTGHSTLYEFEDPESGHSEVAEIVQQDIDGSAHGFHIRWKPSILNKLTLIAAGATGSGDSTTSDELSKSYRQTDIQGDLESYGELYQPELSNLDIRMIGLEWQTTTSMSIALLRYEYIQETPSDEIRDASIDAEPSGLSRKLGEEFNLILSIEHKDALELYVTYAKFNAGDAYASSPEDSSRYIGLDISYSF